MKPYFETALGKLYNMDCLEFMKTMPDKSVDLVVTSPPYDNLRQYEGFNFDFENMAKELFRIISLGGVVVWVVNDATINGSETGTSFRQALYFKKLGFNIHDTMIWEKHTIPQTSNRYENAFEYMFIFSKDKPKTFNAIRVRKIYKDNRKHKNYQRNKEGIEQKGNVPKIETKIDYNIWKINVGGGIVTKSKIAHQHPAIYPEKLAERHIYSWSNKKDIILDPFLGSGTTAIACEKLNRQWIGIEISEKYCEISAKRIDNEAKQGKMF